MGRLTNHPHDDKVGRMNAVIGIGSVYLFIAANVAWVCWADIQRFLRRGQK